MGSNPTPSALFRVARDESTSATLVEAGVLNDSRVGRERLFIHAAFLEVLTRGEGVGPARSGEPTLF